MRRRRRRVVVVVVCCRRLCVFATVQHLSSESGKKCECVCCVCDRVRRVLLRITRCVGRRRRRGRRRCLRNHRLTLTGSTPTLLEPLSFVTCRRMTEINITVWCRSQKGQDILKAAQCRRHRVFSGKMTQDSSITSDRNLCRRHRVVGARRR